MQTVNISPQISVIVPCYNQAAFLDDCLLSVHTQTWSAWECLIIDDGSGDDTEQRVQKWTEKDSRFKYHKKENGGVASARNLGLEKAAGNWILPLDGDDKIGAEYLQLAAEKLSEGFDLVYCKAEFFGLKNEPYFIKAHTYKDLLLNNTIFSAAFFKKDKLQGVRYDENMIHGFEDWEFWISYLSRPELKVCRLEETLFYYRLQHSSRNQNINKDREKLESTKKYILEKHREKYEHEFGDYLHLLHENVGLKDENAHLSKILNSRKHQLIQKIGDFFGR